MKRYDVVAVDRAYTDIIASVDHAFLKKWNIPLDLDRQGDIGEITQIHNELINSRMRTGGPSGNTVSVISALGGRAGFFGKVSADKEGEFFLKDFQDRRVDILNDIYDRTGSVSAKCLVLETQDGSRSMVYNPGCADNFFGRDFLQFDFSAAGFFLVQPFLLISPRAKETIYQAVNWAAYTWKCPVVVNLQNMTSWDNCTQEMLLAVQVSSMVIGNEKEQNAFAGIAKDRVQPNTIMVTTRGKDGAEARVGQKVYTAPAIAPKELISPTGAGDAFTAGFLLGLSRGMDIPTSLRCGVRSATAILGEESGRPADKTPGAWAHLMNG